MTLEDDVSFIIYALVLYGMIEIITLMYINPSIPFQHTKKTSATTRTHEKFSYNTSKNR